MFESPNPLRALIIRFLLNILKSYELSIFFKKKGELWDYVWTFSMPIWEAD